MSDYSGIIRKLKTRYRVRVRRWRKQMSGCAWRVHYRNGQIVNWIEAPYPKTPISLAVFLHEIGHHAIGFRRFRIRCEEEYHVWQWALEQMRQFGIVPDLRVRRRFDRSMEYAVGKALRRGAKRLPAPLLHFATRFAPRG